MKRSNIKSYRSAATALKPQPVVIRTLDLGGDKFLSHLQLPPEMNPFLGLARDPFLPRSNRTSLRISFAPSLRASAEGNVKMMYPMISGLDELNQANALVEECKIELREEGIRVRRETGNRRDD